MSKHIVIAYNAVIAKIIDPDKSTKLLVQQYLSYRVAGAENSAAFKLGNWDGRSSFFDYTKGTFPRGFVDYVSDALSSQGYVVRLAFKPYPEALGVENPIVDAFGNDNPDYDYQMATVNELLKRGQMIAQVATGGGKSKIARLAFARINRPTLFLTTRSILMYQMATSFKNDLGVECSILGDGHFGHENAKGGRSIKKISCGMVQTLAARLRNPDPLDPIEKQNAQLAVQEQTRKLLSIFEFVILEEAHEASGESYYEIMKWCKNAHYRLALTATPFMKDDEEANMRLMACSGSIGIKVSEELLIARGILAKPYFKFVAMKERPSKLLRSTPWQAAYRIGIVENEYRNRHIVYEASRAAQRGMTVAILIQHKKHGELLRDALNAAGIKTEFIFGENDQEERKRAINKLANGDIQVLIGSTILDVGVDVPAIGMVILAGGGKAEVALRQRIGRGLRKKKSGPNVALVVDFTDEGNMHLSSHAKQRQAIIRDTKGFGENIIAGDFDFTGLGL